LPTSEGGRKEDSEFLNASVFQIICHVQEQYQDAHATGKRNTSFSAELHDDRRRAAVKLALYRLPSSVCKGLHACQCRQSANHSPLRTMNEVGGVQVALALLSLSLFAVL
jgi:hypothetical protein